MAIIQYNSCTYIEYKHKSIININVIVLLFADMKIGISNRNSIKACTKLTMHT